MRIMTEAAGCLASASGFKSIREAGYSVIGTDANSECYAKHLVDEFYCVPYAFDPKSKEFLFNLAIEKKIDLVIPSLDEGMIRWAEMADDLKKRGVSVAISSVDTVKICEDKWLTYLKFKESGIPTPKSSLKNEYPLVKPRLGRGGSGIHINEPDVDMEDMISQELLSGTEYTTDVFCNLNNEPIYIVPRQRIGVKEGKSTGGIVVEQKDIIEGIKKICKAIPFVGPFNAQCFVSSTGEVKFTEINPRLGGGTALGMAATENWFPLMVETFVNRKVVQAKFPVRYGMKMGRYYAEVFYS